MSRLETIQQVIAKSPGDPFPRYGLAMELRNLGRYDESHAAFTDLEKRFPEYVPSYLIHGTLLVQMKRVEEARQVLELGIEAARRKPDPHALSELGQALDALAEESD
jgi:tetratricopeptide (TPR) repeat protein